MRLFLILFLFLALSAQAVIPEPAQVIPSNRSSNFQWGKSKVVKKLTPEIMGDEAYEIEICKNKAIIKAKTPKGLFYGEQTLRQLPTGCKRMKIIDSPRFAYRGLMLDPARHFIPVDEIKKHIDVMAMFKLNTLHLHLTDDQAWRLEIKKYPALTSLNAMSPESTGYYTAEQMREIVDYADKHFIDVVPEIDLPGHMLAAISAYPQLSCSGKAVAPRKVWGVEDVVLCAGKDSTLSFLYDVMDEVCDIFPGKYIHLGGDECPKAEWEKCPACQAKIRDLGLNDEEQLQTWLMKEVEDYLMRRHHRQVIGWDEMLEGDCSPSTVIMSWRGSEPGWQASSQGYKVIMCPFEEYYFTHCQGDYRVEPVTMGGYTTLEEAYNYVPDLRGNKDNIIGVQGNVWGEYIFSPDVLDLRAYPRMLAVAETGWCGSDRKDYADFEKRVDEVLPVLDTMGINYFIPRPEQPDGSINQIAFIDSTTITLTTTRPMKIKYTWAGEEHDYTDPVLITHSGEMEVWSMTKHGYESPHRTIKLEKQLPAPAFLSGPECDPVYFANMQLTLVPGQFPSCDTAFNNATRMQPVPINDLRDIRSHPGYSAIVEGEIYVPVTGVYRFSTLNEELWIDGKKIVDNRGLVKRNPATDGTMALQKGLHHFRAIFLDHIIGGIPSRWQSGEVRVTKFD